MDRVVPDQLSVCVVVSLYAKLLRVHGQEMGTKTEHIKYAAKDKYPSTKVLMIGAGGLGSPSSLYLAAAGVGTIGIIDEDIVDDSNLPRQILHTTDRVGMAKTESARQALTALNPDVEVVAYNERLTSANIDRILPGYDLIVDGTDNFPTRYLLNDASVKHDIPVVHASIFRFEGQMTVFT